MVFAVGIGAGYVADQLGIEAAQAGTERVVQPVQVVVVADFVGKIDVDGRRRLPGGIVIFLVKGNREDVAGMGLAYPGGVRGRELETGSRGQRAARDTCSSENYGRAVSLMDVAIHRHSAGDFVVVLHAADSDGYVVNHTEALAVVGKSVVETSANVDGDVVFQGVVSGQNGASCRKPECTHQFRRIRNFHLEFFASGESPGSEFMNILGSVDEQDVLIGRREGTGEVGLLGDAGFQQAIVNAFVLFRGEDVSADGEIVVVAVDELEGKHGLLLAVGRVSFVWPERTMIRAGSSS